MTEAECPCGSGLSYAQCCQPWHQQGACSDTAEALMRSRFSAFSLGLFSYLAATRHPSQRHLEQHDARPSAGPLWRGLKILARSGEQRQGPRAQVHFEAFFIEHKQLAKLVEHSNFEKLGEHWFYVDGEHHVEPIGHKLSRNEACPCTSGKKAKRCCLVHL